MKVAVLSDIHGNAIALDAVLEDLRRRPADRAICLGDCIQGGAQPAEVVARLRALALPVVMGNADAWLLTGVDTGFQKPSPARQAILDAVREWSLARLSESDREFIRSFTPTVEVPLDGPRSLLGFHGTPASYDEILLPETPEAEFRRMLGAHAGRHLLCGGHVHLQFVRRLGESFHFNPGSIGVAYEHGLPEGTPGIDPWAEYAVLESEGDRLALELRRVPYDVAAWHRVLRESGRPHADDAIAQFRS